jgi:hypothetical protein
VYSGRAPPGPLTMTCSDKTWMWVIQSTTHDLNCNVVRACDIENNISTFTFPTHPSSPFLCCFSVSISNEANLGHYRLKFVSIFQLYFWRFTYSFRTLLLLRICLEPTKYETSFHRIKARPLSVYQITRIISYISINCKYDLILLLLFLDWNTYLSKVST